MSRKTTRKKPLADAVSQALPKGPVPLEPPPVIADKQIKVDGPATQLVRQAIADMIDAQPPSMRAVAHERFSGFMERCVVLAAQQ